MLYAAYFFEKYTDIIISIKYDKNAKSRFTFYPSSSMFRYAAYRMQQFLKRH